MGQRVLYEFNCKLLLLCEEFGEERADAGRKDRTAEGIEQS